ncbi:hypothetical protein RFI_02969 [Reticulomyxa filosa]|uniref:Uncharacterized protein n=1 Tax=Reticulomyxa filosa TaxID=46433 RepID=X6P6G7_RETFI|nr:hypothetical protein RFI_02969 [Reticulomyxa filosa]|eukprot:ETO34125.1 hypothetical protein RFI_02969 [Reticulomyxa filosa]
MIFLCDTWYFIVSMANIDSEKEREKPRRVSIDKSNKVRRESLSQHNSQQIDPHTKTHQNQVITALGKVGVSDNNSAHLPNGQNSSKVFANKKRPSFENLPDVGGDCVEPLEITSDDENATQIVLEAEIPVTTPTGLQKGLPVPECDGKKSEAETAPVIPLQRQTSKHRKKSTLIREQLREGDTNIRNLVDSFEKRAGVFISHITEMLTFFISLAIKQNDIKTQNKSALEMLSEFNAKKKKAMKMLQTLERFMTDVMQSDVSGNIFFFFCCYVLLVM